MTIQSVQPPQSARARLLEAAAILFYSNGICATGIDAIVKQAGVAKKSLYNNFSSKADLVAAYLDARHAEWIGLYKARVGKASCSQERVLAVFLAYEDHAMQSYSRGFRGCGLLNAAAELPADDTGRHVVRAHKEQVEALLAQHLEELLGAESHRIAPLAHHFAFLLEGAMARAGLEGRSDCMHQARSIATSMLKAL